MRKKIITIFTCITALLIAAPSFAEEIISESSQLPTELSIHGRLEGIGTYFEIKDSEYLNIALESTEEIKIISAAEFL